MVDWAPNLTSLLLSGGNVAHFGSLCRTHRARTIHNQGVEGIERHECKDGDSRLFPEMRQLRISGNYRYMDVLRIIRVLPRLEKLEIDYCGASRVPTAQLKRSICVAISKLPLVTLSVHDTMFDPILFNKADKAIDSTVSDGLVTSVGLAGLTKLIALRVSIRDLLPGLLQCKQLTDLTCRVPANFNRQLVEDVTSNLPKLRKWSISQILYAGDKKSLSTIASVPSIEMMSCYGRTMIDVESILAARGLKRCVIDQSSCNGCKTTIYNFSDGTGKPLKLTNSGC